MRDNAAQALPTRRRWFTRLATCAFLLLAAGEFYNCVFCCDHDFLWHRNFGIDFLSNNLYESTGQHYLPARAMIDAVTAWMPYRLDRAMWFLAMCGGLAWCTRFWSLVAKPTTKNWLLPAGIALAVMATYIHRDLAECGLQLFLLCLLTAALSALLSGRPARCGAWLGLATVYKVMPLVFLPFLIWKRQWRAAAWMTVFGCFFCLLPAAFLGWEKNRDLHEQWLRNARQRLAIEDPSENGVEPPTLWNRSLPLAIARLVQAYPPGHPLHVDSPGFVRFADLDPRMARRVVNAFLLSLVAALAWRFRHAVTLADCGASLAGEWAVMCILVALLSPLCWLHHLVLATPAALVFAQRAAAGQAPRWQWVAASTAASLMLLVHRGLMSPATWDALSVYSPHTVACLLLATVALGSPASKIAADTANVLEQWEARAAA